MNRPSITLACIMRDEEQNIPQLVKSVEGCFDEIVFVDTGSTDNSIQVAKDLGVRVENFTWCNDFSAARNYAFSQAKTDFVMWLDLDDVLVNPEGFKNFRDDAMAMGDYWIASYHYTSNSEAKPLCTFARERVFRTEKGYQWKYFVHEGVMPNGPTKMQFTPAWSVRHMRTETDIAKDKTRNLELFKTHADTLDHRMVYYYGKELFEHGKYVDSIIQLSKALNTTTELQFHDRVLAMQYLCYCYIQTNQIEQAMGIASSGLLLVPQRAEFYALLGDCYIKQNRLHDAIPSYNAAKSCRLESGPQFGSAIFHSEDAYTVVPRLNLAKIYAQMGDLVAAEKEVQDSVDRWNHEESKAILEEIKRIKSLTIGFKDAKPCDDITIVCPPQAPYLWDADIAQSKSMGGSEIAAIEMASWLHKISGRKVKVFNVREDKKTCDGVEYIPCKEVNEYMAKNKPYLNINWRHNIKLTNAPTFVWCHDLYTLGAEVTDNYEKIMCLTPFHQRYMTATQCVPKEKIYLTRNGLNPKRFKPIDHSKKDPNKFVFSSSPDRGLDRTMLVLDKVREKYPDIKLHVFYGVEHLDNYGLKDLRVKLQAMFEERKDWVVYHGATQQDKLMEEFHTATYAVQPSDWIETSMISSMEQLCSGVYQIRRAVGGCVDTMRTAVESNMATLVESECITPLEYQRYVDATIKAMDEKAYTRIDGWVANPMTYAWQLVAEEWLKDLPNLAGYVENKENNVVDLKYGSAG